MGIYTVSPFTITQIPMQIHTPERCAQDVRVEAFLVLAYLGRVVVHDSRRHVHIDVRPSSGQVALSFALVRGAGQGSVQIARVGSPLAAVPTAWTVTVGPKAKGLEGPGGGVLVHRRLADGLSVL